MTRRVVITGMAGISPLGSNWPTARKTLQDGRSCVVSHPHWNEIEGLQTRLGAPVTDFEKPEHFGRKKTRSMGRVALLATHATELALQQAGLLD